MRPLIKHHSKIPCHQKMETSAASSCLTVTFMSLPNIHIVIVDFFTDPRDLFISAH